MKQKLIVIVIVLSVICLLTASAVSIVRAKHAPAKPQEQPEQPEQSEQQTEPPTDQQTEPEQIEGVQYYDYTGQAHPGTGIAYRGTGENAAYVIVIDAGHQLHAMSELEPIGPGATETKAKVTGGTQGALTGLAEYELNLRVALALRDVLVERGYTVIMIREVHEVEISNAERAQLANRAGADAFIRIHANGDANAQTKGAMTVCQTQYNPYNADIYESCRRLSDALLQAFCQGTGISQRNVWETDTMSGTNWASVPTTIVEMGFMTNAQDEQTMATEGFAATAAVALAKGLEAYLTGEVQEDTTEDITKEDTTEDTTEEVTDEIPDYVVDTELEESFGMSFADAWVMMKATGNVWVRTEPSAEQGATTRVSYLEPGDLVRCVGKGEKWHRVLIDGKVYYVSAAYLQEVTE